MMAAVIAGRLTERPLASLRDLELVVPECDKGIGSLISSPESPDLIDGVGIQPLALYPDDRGYFMEIQRVGQGLYWTAPQWKPTPATATIAAMADAAFLLVEAGRTFKQQIQRIQVSLT